ncbi:MAG: fibronectin type III domain-containing protein, partial [Planctomycetaceae bacterium]|nr:fibronectin type III domain-containing protein [Planctomycetaceae bacterium]
MKNLIQKVFGKNKSKACLHQKISHLHFESLEERALLAVTAAEFDQIREQYPDFYLKGVAESYRVIEITASELSEANLRQAINQATTTIGNHLIVVRTTETQNTITLSGSELAINIGKDMQDSGTVYIVSLGTMPLTIDANQQSRHFRVEGGLYEHYHVHFVGISFTNGYCSKDGGGAIFTTSSQLFISYCTFLNNVAAGSSGGAIHAEKEIYFAVNNCTFRNNTAGLGGGAISAVGTNNLSFYGIGNTDFTGNQSGRDGGAVYAKNVSSLHVGSVTGNVNFIDNTALNGNGGGLWVEADRNVSVRIEYVTFEGNKANCGGGLGVMIGNSITASNLVFRGNWAQQYGGAMFFEGVNGRVANVTAANNTSGADSAGLSIRESPYLRIENASFPTNLRSTARTPGSVTLIWNAATGATGYVLQYKKATDTTWTTATVASGALTATVSGLSADTDYNFRVQAANAGGASDWSAVTVTTEAIDDTPPAVPTNFRYTGQTTNSVTLAWNNATGATGYRLEYKKASDTDWTEFPVADGALTATISGLSADTNYNFRIRATNDNGSSDWATANAATLMQPPQAPVNFRSTTRQTSSVTLAWDAAERTTGYVLQYKRTSDANWTTAAAPTGTSTTITGLTANTAYHFRIQATNSGGASDWVTINATTLMIAPQNFRSTVKTANTVALAWNAVTGATGYELQYKELDAPDWTATPAQFGTSAIISGLTAGTDYIFRIRAANTDSVTNWTTIYVTTNVLPPPIPTNFRSTARQTNSVTLAWDAATDATGYVLQYKKAIDAAWTTAAAPTGTSTTITGLTANTAYHFRMQATNTGGASDWSTTVNVTTLVQSPPNPSNFRSTDRSEDSVTLAWNAAERATGYVLQYKRVSDANWTTAAAPTGASAVITDLTANTAYHFRIQAFNEGGSSSWSNIDVITLPSSSIIMPSDDAPHEWAVRKSLVDMNTLEIVDLKNGDVVFSQSLDTLDYLKINSSAGANDSLTIDFSNGVFSLDNGIQFNGHAETYDTLYFIGSTGDDSVMIAGMENRFNDLMVYTQNIEHFVLDGGTGKDQALVVGADSNNSFAMSGDLFVMIGGGYRMELGNFNVIDAIASGRNDQTYIYAENDSLIVMNDIFVEQHDKDQSYRIWYSKYVTVINMDDTNNAILHSGSRGYDVFTLSEGYGLATNAVGSYFHEFIDFKNVNISTTHTMPTVSLPTAVGWSPQEDRGVWKQNGFTATVMGNANVTTRNGSVLPQKPAAV